LYPSPRLAKLIEPPQSADRVQIGAVVRRPENEGFQVVSERLIRARRRVVRPEVVRVVVVVVVHTVRMRAEASRYDRLDRERRDPVTLWLEAQVIVVDQFFARNNHTVRRQGLLHVEKFLALDPNQPLGTRLLYVKQAEVGANRRHKHNRYVGRNGRPMAPAAKRAIIAAFE